MVDPMKREDISEELASKIEDETSKRFPGMRVVFVGDIPADDLPPEIREAMQKMRDSIDKSLATGCCLDCGVIMPGYPAEPEGMTDEWQPAKGWCHFNNGEEFGGWQCPECDAKASYIQLKDMSG